MKKTNQILSIILIIVMLVASISIYNSHSEIKTIKSEKQLMQIYNSESDIPFITKIFTLPFSLLYNDSYNHSYKRYGRDYNVVEDAEFNGTTSSKSSESTRDYSKTNIQVEGVDEADIIKTDGNYIYSISNNNIIITNAKDSENVKVESKINTESAIPNDLLLYKDKLVVFLTSYNSSNSYYDQKTKVEVYDVNDAKNPKMLKSFELNEPYYTTRCIDGRLYVFSKGYLKEKNDKIDRSYKEDNKSKEIELNNIKYIKNNIYDIQTLIAELDLNKMDDIRLSSYLIDISNAYVSHENIYLLDQDYNYGKVDISSLFTLKGVFGVFESAERDNGNTTHIYKFKIDKKKGVSLKASTTIKGKIVNQYSVDEKDENLRIALESDEGTRIAILDKKLDLLGETDSVAEGERMYASRFMGDKAYLVTYRNTDPLFVVDLSNVNNPEVMGELKIPGYSTYLHPYDETHLIGIGMDTEEHVNRDSDGKVTSTWVTVNGMKMCLFDVSDINNPKEIAKTTIGDRRTVSAILTNPKALLFSKEKNLLAIPVNNYEEEFEVETSTTYEDEINKYTNYNKNRVGEGYFVYNIDLEDGFALKGIIKHETENNSYYYYYKPKLLRGLYIDNDLYTVSENSIKVNRLDDLTEVSSIKINKKGAEKNEG